MDNQQLLKRIEALEKWKADRERQQIVFPLDFQSQTILSNYFMRIIDTITYITVGAEEHVVTSYIGEQNQNLGSNGQIRFQVGNVNVFPYTVNATTNILTVPGGQRFEDGTAVSVYYAPDGALPSPLAVNTTYYVVSSTGTSFKLSATSGGAEINITDTGTGRQFIEKQL